MLKGMEPLPKEPKAPAAKPAATEAKPVEKKESVNEQK